MTLSIDSLNYPKFYKFLKKIDSINQSNFLKTIQFDNHSHNISSKKSKIASKKSKIASKKSKILYKKSKIASKKSKISSKKAKIKYSPIIQSKNRIVLLKTKLSNYYKDLNNPIIKSGNQIIAILKYSGLWYNKKSKEVKCSWILLDRKLFPLFSQKIGLAYLFEEDNKQETCIYCGGSTIQPQKKDTTTKQIETSIKLKAKNPSNTYNSKNNPKNHPIYGKFYKMLAMGVPLPAVKQKIVMSGLNPQILENTNLLVWKPTKKAKSKGNPLFQEIALGKSRLSKVDPLTIKSKKKRTSYKSNLSVPTLNDILGAIKRLRSSRKK